MIEQRLAGKLVAEILGPTKPGELTGITGLPNFAAAALQTALMSSPIIAGTQV